MYCPLGNHVLRGSGEYITNPQHIRFINKLFPDFLVSERVCAKCKQDIANAYEYKMKRALSLRAQNGSLISSFSTEESLELDSRRNKRNDNARNIQKDLVGSSTTSATTADDDDDGQPSTSAQAAAKRKRQEERRKQRQLQKDPLAINIQRGARLPHIQPVARRQQFVHANRDIMDIYLRGTTGG